MTYEQLEHAIRAACDVSNDDELWVFGSQAILGAFPDSPESLLTSIEVDVQPKNRPEEAESINGALGELSQFHQTHGFYVHGMPIASIDLPKGWEKRVVPVKHPVLTRNHTGWCLEAHDLAVSKLAAFREKDRDFIRILIMEKMIKPGLFMERVRLSGGDTERQERFLKWIRKTAAECGM